jgi:hypothetical protein
MGGKHSFHVFYIAILVIARLTTLAFNKKKRNAAGPWALINKDCNLLKSLLAPADTKLYNLSP